jgi:thioesterase domain-containing protein
MAAHYVEEIVSFRPQGPIYLAGYSVGGLIAFEIARQIHRRGRQVALLALFDSVPIMAIPWGFYALWLACYLPGRCLAHFRNWCSLPFHEQPQYIRGRWVALRNLLRPNRSRKRSVMVPVPAAGQLPQAPRFDDYYATVASTYRIRPYPDSADVFLSDETPAEWRWYWRYILRGRVSFHPVKGRHLEILQSPELLSGLAEALTVVLDRVQHQEMAARFNGEK